jgi:hypothetical protein
VPLDESCYREVGGVEIFVITVGGRYGSEASGQRSDLPRDFFERYDSITKKELEEALRRDIPTYVLIDAAVYSEYQTYLRNKDRDNISYAQVDSVNVFRLIEEILSRPKNNPMHTFERFADIESWLREQWAGLFRELLNRMASQQQLAALSSQVSELKEVSGTLRTYLEAVVTSVSPDRSAELIQSEQERLEEAERRKRFANNDFVNYMSHLSVDLEDAIDAVSNATSIEHFRTLIERVAPGTGLANTLESKTTAVTDFNVARQILNKKPLFPRKRKEKDSADA